jgi:hypothetical protein
MISTQAGVKLRPLAGECKREGREIAAKDQPELRYAEADRKCENEARQASEDLLRRAQLAVNEVGKEAKADLLVEPGHLADQGSLVGPGLQAETGIYLNVGITIDRDRDVQ